MRGTKTGLHLLFSDDALCKHTSLLELRPVDGISVKDGIQSLLRL